MKTTLCRRFFANFRVSEVLLKTAGLEFRAHLEYTSVGVSVVCIPAAAPAFHPGLIVETTCLFGFHGRCVRHEIMEPFCIYMDVSKNRGTSKWMVNIMENPIKMDDLGGTPYFWKHPYACHTCSNYTVICMCFLFHWKNHIVRSPPTN